MELELGIALGSAALEALQSVPAFLALNEGYALEQGYLLCLGKGRSKPRVIDVPKKTTTTPRFWSTLRKIVKNRLRAW